MLNPLMTAKSAAESIANSNFRRAALGARNSKELKALGGTDCQGLTKSLGMFNESLQHLLDKLEVTGEHFHQLAKMGKQFCEH